MSLLIGRFDELILYASADYRYATLVLLALMIVSLAWWEKGRNKIEGDTHS
jgi:hypothetical protein